MHRSRDVHSLEITGRELFDDLVRKLSVYFIEHIDAPNSFEDLRKTVYARILKPLVLYLTDDVDHPAVLNALLALKWHFVNIEAGDDRGISETRSLACELVAWRLVTHLAERDAIDHLCYELPTSKQLHEDARPNGNVEVHRMGEAVQTPIATDRTPLLDGQLPESDESYNEDNDARSACEEASFASIFAGLNALEIAAVAGAKHFLSQKAVQRVIDGIWKGDIVFDMKMFEVLFFGALLAFYYVVLIQKSTQSVSTAEGFLYVWLAAFAYNELAEYWDAGTALYVIDFWSLWDLSIIVTGLAFSITRMIGLAKDDHETMEIAFDILSIEALFLVPRICSVLSLHPYFGTLLPCLKEMTKDFVNFVPLVAILYIGFNTTFAFLARGTYSVSKMNWILVKVFFGSSYLGFDVAEEISPILGPPLMFIFVCLTNILLVTSLISLLSNSLTKVMEHARQEYLFGYAVFVMEASNSNRLTYFLPPLNLIPLMLRPLRLVVPAESFRQARIVLLKATHFPFVVLILILEATWLRWDNRPAARMTFARSVRGPATSSSLRHPLSGKLMQSPVPATGTGSTLLASPAQQPHTAGSPVGRQSREGPEAAFETVTMLVAAVGDLKHQVETLKLLIDKQQSGDPTSSS